MARCCRGSCSRLIRLVVNRGQAVGNAGSELQSVWIDTRAVFLVNENGRPEHISTKLSFVLPDKPIKIDDCCLMHLASFRPDAIRADAESRSALLDVTSRTIADKPIK
jgi:hypothetical protein